MRISFILHKSYIRILIVSFINSTIKVGKTGKLNFNYVNKKKKIKIKNEYYFVNNNILSKDSSKFDLQEKRWILF